MSDFDNTNKGVLFPEKGKKNDKSPDYTGKINVDGKDLRLAGWKRQSKNGQVFLSLAISELTETKQKSLGEQWRSRDTVAEVSDSIDINDIPF